MSSSWHWWIVIVTLINVLACVWLILWSSRQGDNSKANEDTLDHSWDGNLQERNNPLPRWWLYLFVGTIVWGIGYFVYYPGLGNFAGTGEWSQISQYEAERERIDAVYQQRFAELAAQSYQQLQSNADALNVAHSLYGANCATCHGADARGAKGFPNLTDDDWIWGGSIAAITQSIQQGRQAAMPPWGTVLGEDGTREVVAYVKSLSGLRHSERLATAGKARYDALCVACHGADGNGMQALGAPNLTDDVWLYGSSDDDLTHSVAKGRAGVMPAHDTLLSAEEIKLLTAYVLSLQGGS